MVNKILVTFILADFLFLITGGLLIGFALVTHNEIASTPTKANVARNLILDVCPLKGENPLELHVERYAET